MDFDIETRKIGFHDGGRFSPGGCEAVIIAASRSLDDPVEWRGLDTTWRPEDVIAMLRWFTSLWAEADVVTGHYVRKFDIPIIQGSIVEMNTRYGAGLPLLGPKKVSDTHGDLPKIAGISKSQENLGEMMRIGSKKFHMNDTLWREVARLTRYGLDEAHKRVIDDVRQHQEERLELVDQGLLTTPRRRMIW